MSLTGFYKRIENTVVSGSELQSDLTAEDIRQLNFTAALANPYPVVCAAGVQVLKPENWIEMAIGSQAVNSAVSGDIMVGPDTNSQALQYVNLFNLRTTTDVRVLRMFESAGSPLFASLVASTSSAPTTFVKVANNGTANTTGAQVLFVQATGGSIAITGAVGLPGSERIVLVSASNLSAGSQSVTFNILGYSL